MFGHFIVVLGQVGTLFMLMAVGYVLGKKQWFTETGCAQCSSVLLYVVAPCIMLRTLQIDKTPEAVDTLLRSAVVFSGFYLVTILLSLLFFRRQPPLRKSVLRFGIVYGNTGFMGLPLVEAVLGKEALLPCVVGFVLFSLAHWSHGAAVMGGKLSPRRMLLNPATLSSAVGLILFFASARLPVPLLKSVSYLADVNTPLAMLIIGSQMSRTDFARTFRQPLLYAAAAVKLALVPALAVLLLLPFGLPPLIFSTCVILAATPTAGATGMFAQRFGQDTAAAAQLITLSTLLSALTLPVFGMLVQRLAG